MEFSQAFYDLRIHFECSGDVSKFLFAYQDRAGVWTIGIGTTHYPDGTPVKEGDTCTIEQAIEYAANDTKHISAILPQNITQGLFDAGGDFSYNAGIGAWKSSTLYHNIQNNIPIEKHNFTDWDKAHVNGQLVELDGLLRRRMAEYYLAVNGVNSPDFCVGELEEYKNAA